MRLPARSTIAGGLGGVAVWIIGMGLNHFGIQVPQDDIEGAVALVTVILVHLVPDSLQDQAKALNVKVQDLANWLPEAKYPDESRGHNQ